MSLKRKQDQTIRDFLLEFHEYLNETMSHGNILSDDLKAYQLLESVNISEADIKIIKAPTVQLTYKNVQEALRRCFGDSTYSTQTLKSEPVIVNHKKLNLQMKMKYIMLHQTNVEIVSKITTDTVRNLSHTTVVL